MCLLDEKCGNLVREWDVSGVPPEHKDGLYISLRDHLDDRPWVLTADTVLIEKQPERNKKMISVMHFLHSYFIIKAPRCETILYDARHKIPDVAGPGKAQYNKRKKVSIERCEAFIRDGPINAHWLPVFEKSKKKKTTKLVARRPNENQKMTKYSKSNLAWIYLNKPECECLENNKRFMKDLKRYYRDLNDLIKDLNG